MPSWFVASRPLVIAGRALLLALSLLPVLAIASSVAGRETLLGIVGRDFVLLGADSSSSSSSGVALASTRVDKILVLRTHARVVAAVAAAGDVADADRLLGLLQAHASLRAYASPIGGWEDVERVFDGGGGSSAVGRGVRSDGLDAASVAHRARADVAGALRSGAPLRACLLVGGLVEPRRRRGGRDYDDDDDDDDDDDQEEMFSERVRTQMSVAKRRVVRRDEINDPVEDDDSVVDDDEEVTRRSSTSRLRPRLFWLDEYGSLQRLRGYGAHGLGANFALSVLDQGYRPDLTRKEAARLMRDCFKQLRTRFVINSPQPPCLKCVDANGCHLVLD